jgi:hypothetical protein
LALVARSETAEDDQPDRNADGEQQDHASEGHRERVLAGRQTICTKDQLMATANLLISRPVLERLYIGFVQG